MGFKLLGFGLGEEFGLMVQLLKKSYDFDLDHEVILNPVF
jgi:hypothetical protein